jgi:hypothetical protein
MDPRTTVPHESMLDSMIATPLSWLAYQWMTARMSKFQFLMVELFRK